MKDIYKNLSNVVSEYGVFGNLVIGVNIVGFFKVVDIMIF